MTGCLLENVRLNGGEGPVEILMESGTIRAIAPRIAVPEGLPRLDGGGGLVLRPMVDGHVHLDKTRLGLPFESHVPGASVAERIAVEERLRADRPDATAQCGAALIERMAGFGTMALRSHADITPGAGLAGLEAELALRERYRGVMDIQIVAFPQTGVIRVPGLDDLLDAALKMGADLVGGLDPAGFDEEIAAQLDTVFALADKHGAGVDIHLHDPGTLGTFELRQIAARARRYGLEGRVAVSHAYCLGQVPGDDFARTADLLAESGVDILTNVPSHVEMPPVADLEARGVTVFLGSDNIRDAWSPFGTGDMFERAALLCQRWNWREDADLEHACALASEVPARVLGLRSDPIAPGTAADLLIVGAACIADAIATRPARRTLLRAGRVIAENGRLRAAGNTKDQDRQ
ncbi:amidohydrolase [Salipiger sp. P9]|uniref:amidohydrolase n=1 Tax=Salipiger pentaromativorans TaxID=2943193 RepID=UPI002157A62A|nr:amidohydrolase [Salipiger pentaromativorans]MCR8546893.1 amidohydrolase [Salipiger pentaromativorans]